MPDEHHNTTDFTHRWVAETIRLHEIRSGPLEDTQEIRQALRQRDGLADRLLYRAARLGEREGLFAAVQRWCSLARISAMVLALIAVIGGATVALGVFSATQREVNILVALVAVLGLPTLTLIFWLVSLVMPSGQRHGGLGEFWLWMNRRLSRHRNQIDLTRALVSLLSRHRVLQPLLGAISNGFWLLALLATTLMTTGLLSARRYVFNWETTLLSSDTFVWMATTLGKPLSVLGLNGPEPDVIRLSDGMHVLPESAHLQWSAWLIGCLMLYGMLPRLIALICTLWLARRRVASMAVDVNLPGHAELRSRLEPVSLPGGIDSPAPLHIHTPDQTSQVHANATGAAIVGIELSEDHRWPPGPLQAHIAPEHGVRDLGVVDAWQQRQQAIANLQVSPPRKLLIACDGAQTPDRGTIMLIKQLASLAHTTHIMLPVHHPSDRLDGANRIPVWHSTLHDAGFSADHIHADDESALAWLHAPS
ncbi:MAG TPA: DUF2868 domain-containing protein [Burkholderiaceae bacterium]|nr:DUF2868 domain-containing protein [Burkholderiaceae bacterium]